MDILIIEPEKAPFKATISGDLKSIQDIVGGHIEAIYPYDDPVALVCNEEGKLIGLPLNRKIEDYDIIAGTFFICGIGHEDFTSLSPELSDKYQKKFANPEIFMKMGSQIIAIPVKPQKQKELQKLFKKPSELEL